MQIVYQDQDLIVVNKPARVLSTDEPGGVPDLVRQALEQPEADVRTVHRLDRVVSGVMVLARNAKAASELSRQVRENEFQKEYLAVVHGTPPAEGTLQDLVWRDKARRMTMVTDTLAKGVQEAVLEYWVLASRQDMSRVRVLLHTGRTHQIRVQFASRGWPLVGERKYAVQDDDCEIALFSHRLAFRHPFSGDPMEFTLQPPKMFPWDVV